MPEQVTALPRPESNPEMSLFGTLIALPLVIIALPVLPFVALYWAYSKLVLDEGRDRAFEP